MFRDEYLAMIDALNPEHPDRPVRVEVLVDGSEVKEIQGDPRRHRPVAALLRVSLMYVLAGKALVVLPQPAIPVGERVFVDASQMLEF